MSGRRVPPQPQHTGLWDRRPATSRPKGMTRERRLTWRLPTRGTPARTGISTGYGRGCSVRRSSTTTTAGRAGVTTGATGWTAAVSGDFTRPLRNMASRTRSLTPAALSSSSRRASRLNGASSTSINRDEHVVAQPGVRELDDVSHRHGPRRVRKLTAVARPPSRWSTRSTRRVGWAYVLPTQALSRRQRQPRLARLF